MNILSVLTSLLFYMFLEEIDKMRQRVRSLSYYVKNGVPNCWRQITPKAIDQDLEFEKDRYEYDRMILNEIILNQY